MSQLGLPFPASLVGPAGRKVQTWSRLREPERASYEAGSRGGLGQIVPVTMGQSFPLTEKFREQSWGDSADSCIVHMMYRPILIPYGAARHGGQRSFRIPVETRANGKPSEALVGGATATRAKRQEPEGVPSGRFQRRQWL